MKVGISTATFFTRVLTEDSFSVIRRLGGECAEVFLTTWYEYEPSFADLLAARREEAGVEVYSVHALNTQFEPELFNSAPRTRSDAETVFEKVLAVGEKLGAKCYTFHGRTRLKRTAHIDPEAFGRRLEELGRRALDHGITLCLENVHWAAFSFPEFFADAKAFCPSVGAVLDIKQARQSGRDWRDYIAAMGTRLKNVHISDCDSEDRIALVGKGCFPFDDLVSRLTASGYAGPLIIEQYAGDYASMDEVAGSVEYIKNIIGGKKC